MAKPDPKLHPAIQSYQWWLYERMLSLGCTVKDARRMAFERTA